MFAYVYHNSNYTKYIIFIIRNYPYREVVTFMIFSTIHCNYTNYTFIHYYVYKTNYKYRIYSIYTRFSLLLVKNNNNNDLLITPH